MLPEPVQRLMRSLPMASGGSGNGNRGAGAPGVNMDLLRTLTSALGHYDRDADDQSPAANNRKAIRLTSQIASIVATIGRIQAGGGPLDPDPVLGHAANFLYMLTGNRP